MERAEGEAEAHKQFSSSQKRADALASDLLVLRNEFTASKEEGTEKDKSLRLAREQCHSAEQQIVVLRQQVATERQAFVDADRNRERVQRDLTAKEAEADSLMQQLSECSRAKRGEVNVVAELRAQICRMEAQQAETKRLHDEALQTSRAAADEATQSLDRLRTENITFQEAVAELKREGELRTKQQHRMMYELEASVREKGALIDSHEKKNDAIQKELQAIKEEAAVVDERSAALRSGSTRVMRSFYLAMIY